MDGSAGNARQVQGRPLRRLCLPYIPIMDLHVADTQATAARIEPDLTTISHGTVDESTRDNRPEALDGKRPVHIEAPCPPGCLAG